MSCLMYGTGVSLESLLRLRWEQISAEPFKNRYHILVDGDRFPISFPLFLALRSNLRFAELRSIAALFSKAMGFYF